MFSNFKVKPPGTHVLCKRGARRFELDSSNERLLKSTPILEFYDREIALLEARSQSLVERDAVKESIIKARTTGLQQEHRNIPAAAVFVV